MAKSYVPDEGDIIWINFNPQVGHEQSGLRPAVVLSSAEYNRWKGLLVCCPMTTKIKNYPFEIKIEGAVSGVVLADQIKNFDWRNRGVRYKGKVSKEELIDIRDVATTLINNITKAKLALEKN